MINHRTISFNQEDLLSLISLVGNEPAPNVDVKENELVPASPVRTNVIAVSHLYSPGSLTSTTRPEASSEVPPLDRYTLSDHIKSLTRILVYMPKP